jgi:hypothetical protein
MYQTCVLAFCIHAQLPHLEHYPPCHWPILLCVNKAVRHVPIFMLTTKVHEDLDLDLHHVSNRKIKILIKDDIHAYSC